MAVLGRARAYFSLNKYPEALQGYQQTLEYAPDQIDPDPRIGIGCCFWALGHKDEAQVAWQRALEIVRAQYSVFLPQTNTIAEPRIKDRKHPTRVVSLEQLLAIFNY